LATPRKGTTLVLLAVIKQIIGQSELYSSAAAMENGIASVKKNGPDTSIDILT